MKALWFDGRNLRLKEMPGPVMKKNEALIRVLYAGICSTDLEIFKGYMRFVGIPGHEFVGAVEKGPGQWLGKRVTGEINLACGKCRYCQSGRARHCPQRTVLGISKKNGAFAEYLTLPVANLHQVPDTVSDLDAVLVEPLAAALRILDQVEIRRNQKVLVLGDGKLGQLIARAVRLKTRNLLMVGKHPKKLALAKNLGIKTALAQNCLKIPASHKAEIVIEATGNPQGLEQAMELCRPEGTMVLKSTFHQAAKLNLARIVVDEIKIFGSRCGDFEKALSLLSRRKIRTRDIISGIYPLDEFSSAFHKSISRDSLKVVFKCWE